MQYHWESQGHEVKKSLYYDPALADWCDIYWAETCDNNLGVATSYGDPGWKFSEMDMTNKQVICRVIDIEAWCGLHRNVDWHYVDDVIFIAPHIKELVEKDIKFEKTNVHVVPCGVDLDKFSFVDKKNEKKIAWVAERWFAKGIDYFLQYAAMLYKIDPEYKIYSVGIWADNAREGWYREYIDYFIRHNKMNVEFIDHVDNMDSFLSEMDYVTCFSKKEAFSYAIAEGMAKGCKPIIHNFYGCDQIWLGKYVWNTLDQAINMTLSNYNRKEYRKDIERYSIDKMFKSFDNIIKKGDK
jgi:glycosyltransferase involved in cell wall biosynthesis